MNHQLSALTRRAVLLAAVGIVLPRKVTPPAKPRLHKYPFSAPVDDPTIRGKVTPR